MGVYILPADETSTRAISVLNKLVFEYINNDGFNIEDELKSVAGGSTQHIFFMSPSFNHYLNIAIGILGKYDNTDALIELILDFQERTEPWQMVTGHMEELQDEIEQFQNWDSLVRPLNYIITVPANQVPVSIYEQNTSTMLEKGKHHTVLEISSQITGEAVLYDQNGRVLWVNDGDSNRESEYEFDITELKKNLVSVGIMKSSDTIEEISEEEE